jgi:hypothetical protein
METDDRIEKAKLHNEARELVQRELQMITDDSNDSYAQAKALHAIALTLYAREFLK